MVAVVMAPILVVSCDCGLHQRMDGFDTMPFEHGDGFHADKSKQRHDPGLHQRHVLVAPQFGHVVQISNETAQRARRHVIQNLVCGVLVVHLNLL